MTTVSKPLRGFVSLLALAALLVGVPAALVAFVGRPWPTVLTPARTIWRSLQAGDISDATVMKALALVIWLAWVRLALSIAVEVAARMAGRTTPRLRGLGSFQHWAAALVAGVVLLVGVGSKAPVSAGAAPRPIAVALLDTSWTPTETPETSGTVAVATDVPHRDHIVQRNESFWSIAEATLGDGVRWREIVELNNGVEVAPGVFFDGTANRLLPGWVLHVPDPGGITMARTVVVEAGDTLAEIAAATLGDADAWPPIWEANHGRQFGTRTFDDPNLIIPGWELVIPAAFTPAPTSAVTLDVAEPVGPAATSSPAGPLGPAVPVGSVGPAEPAVPAEPVGPAATSSSGVPMLVGPVPSEGSPVDVAPAAGPRSAGDAFEAHAAGSAQRSTPAPATITLPALPELAASGAVPMSESDATSSERTVERASVALPSQLGAAVLVSGGVLGAAVGRRRRRMRAAGVNERFAPPSEQAIATEMLLRRLGSDERIVRLDVAVRAAASALVEHAPGVGVIGAIVDPIGRIDLLLAGAAAMATPPWTAVGDHRWRVDATIDLVDLADAARRSGQPCPALCHLGATPLDDGNEPGQLFVDLEAIGLLTIQARADHAEQVVRAIATGIAVSPLAETAHLVTCGIDVTRIGPGSVTTAASVDTALDLAASAIGTTASTASATSTTFTLRARQQGGEAWEPAVVIATAAAAPFDMALDADLVALTRTPGRGLAVVVGRPVSGATWRAEQQRHGWLLHPLGIEFTPVGLTADDLANVRVVLDEADRAPLPAEPIATGTGGVVDVVDPSWARIDPPIVVRLLGPIEVQSADGRIAAFERSKAIELVVWLSQHRDRSTRTSARTALWETDVRDATFANVVSDARRSLARLVAPPAGDEWIGRTLTEHLPLHADVVTDADLLATRLAAARGLPTADGIDLLRPGLELVRDIPFASTTYLWPAAEGVSTQCTLLVTSAATVLAGMYLDRGDTEGVFWATGQGLRALSGHEELIALRMRAHAQDGDLSGVRREWENYERVLVGDPWSDSEPAPKLVALRRQLLSA